MQIVDRIKEKVQLELWAASKIQALYRGVVGRLLFDQRVIEKKGIWKELFDEEKKKRFFYNKLTGEVRWRMPQDLLDLIPRPKCDNCSFYEAGVECSFCNEFFCSQCWDQVHFGGRRKDHEFRSLYDYYGKRLDYGDDLGNMNHDFPCKWPSDVMQDEVHGWMLRVAPLREPLAVHGAWEEYTEESATGESKTFYFNRDNFEATYDKPEEVSSNVPASDSNINFTSDSYEALTYDESAMPTSGSIDTNLILDAYNTPIESLIEEGNKGHYNEQGTWVYEYDYPPDTAPSSSFRW
jgi:hypothetical protein